MQIETAGEPVTQEQAAAAAQVLVEQAMDLGKLSEFVVVPAPAEGVSVLFFRTKEANGGGGGGVFSLAISTTAVEGVLAMLAASNRRVAQ